MQGKRHIDEDMDYKLALGTTVEFLADKWAVDLEDADERARFWLIVSNTESQEAKEFGRLLAGAMLMDSCLATL